MTNPDREELVNLLNVGLLIENGLNEKLAQRIGAQWKAKCDELAALRRLASSDSGVKGEPEPVAWPANLTPRTLDLVQRFALALAKKLRRAEEKYGHTDGWSRDDWEAECRDHLYQHLEKGDPRDVAAYCAFMWHHDWITYRPATTTPSDNEKIKCAVRLLDQFDRDATIGTGVSTMLRSTLGVIGQRGAAPPADVGMREALKAAQECIARETTRCIRLEQTIRDTIQSLERGSTSAPVVECLKAALTAPGANTKSAGGVTLEMETRRADDNGRSCKHFCNALRLIASGAPDAAAIASAAVKMPWLLDEVGPSDPSSTRSEVTALTKRLDQVLKVMRGARNRGEPMAVWADDIKAVEDARALLDQFEIRRK